jgi:hypothetical protein
LPEFLRALLYVLRGGMAKNIEGGSVDADASYEDVAAEGAQEGDVVSRNFLRHARDG